jgi:hypothetical protein
VAVEEAACLRIRRALEAGELRLEPAGPVDIGSLLPRDQALPPGMPRLLARDPGGRCVFLEEAGLCAVHRQLGVEALARACRLFPRVCVWSPRGVSISLSHYCPTAAAALFRDDRPLDIEVDPPAFDPDEPYEGLDVRASYPPLLRPEVLMCWDSYPAWERHCVQTLGRDELSPEDALLVLAASAERARSWRSEGPPLPAFVRETVAAHSQARPLETAPRCPDEQAVVSLVRRIRQCIPSGVPAEPQPAGPGLPKLDEDAWATLGAPTRRYLAARAFASWPAHQGRGLRSAVFSLIAAWAVLRAEAAHLCAEAGRRLDRELALEAIRRTDRLLIHLCAPDALVRVYDSAEAKGLPALCKQLLGRGITCAVPVTCAVRGAEGA